MADQVTPDSTMFFKPKPKIDDLVREILDAVYTEYKESCEHCKELSEKIKQKLTNYGVT